MALYDNEKGKGIDNRYKRKPVVQNKNKRSEPSVSKSNTNARQGLSSSNTTNTRGSVVPLSAPSSNVNGSFLGDTARGAGRSLRTIAPNLEGTGVDQSIKTGEKRLFRTPEQADWTGSAGSAGNTKKNPDEVLKSRAEKQVSTDNPNTWSSINSRYKKTGDVAGFNQIRDTETGKDNIYTNLDAAGLREGMNSRGGYVESNSGAAGSIYGKDSMENYMRELRNKQETHAYNRGLEVDARKQLRQGNKKAAQELMGKIVDPGTVASNTRMQSFNTEAETNRQNNQLDYEESMIAEQGKQDRATQKQLNDKMSDISSELSKQTYDFWTNEQLDENGVPIGENVNNEGVRYTQEFMMAQPNLSEIQSRSTVKDYFNYLENPTNPKKVAPPEAIKELLSNPNKEMLNEFYKDYEWLPKLLR